MIWFPTSASGYARAKAESAYPDLWPASTDYLWHPGLTRRQSSIRNHGNGNSLARTRITLSNGPYGGNDGWGPGPSGMGLYPTFNGSSHYAQSSTTLNLTAFTTLSFFLWVRCTTLAGNIFESSASYFSNAGAVLLYTNETAFGGNLCWLTLSPGGGDYNGVTFAQFAANEWVSVAGNFNRGGGSQQVTNVWINGVAQSLTVQQTGTGSGSFGTYTWNFMARNSGASNFQAGTLGPVMLFPGKTLTEATVRRLHRGDFPLKLRTRKYRVWEDGGVTTSPSPVAMAASVVAAALALSQAGSPIGSAGSVTAPTPTASQAVSPVASTGTVAGSTATVSNAQGAVSIGGTVSQPDFTAFPSPIVVTGSVVTPVGSLGQAASAVGSAGSVAAPATTISNTQGSVTISGAFGTQSQTVSAGPNPIPSTASVVAPETSGGAITESAQPIVVTASGVAPASSLNLAQQPTTASGSVASPSLALGLATGATTISGTVPAPTNPLSFSPGAVSLNGAVASYVSSLVRTMAPATATFTVPSAATSTTTIVGLVSSSADGFRLTDAEALGFSVVQVAARGFNLTGTEAGR